MQMWQKHGDVLFTESLHILFIASTSELIGEIKPYILFCDIISFHFVFSASWNIIGSVMDEIPMLLCVNDSVRLLLGGAEIEVLENASTEN